MCTVLDVAPHSGRPGLLVVRGRVIWAARRIGQQRHRDRRGWAIYTCGSRSGAPSAGGCPATRAAAAACPAPAAVECVIPKPGRACRASFNDEEYRRIGEAKNPGPPYANWCDADGTSYRDPEVTGFWGARAPGHRAHDAEEDDAARHSLCVVSANATSWEPLKKFLCSTAADVILAQEHHLPPHRVAEASDWARRRRWHSIILPAAATEAGGWSAGVAIFARPHAALSAPRIGSEVVVPSRIVAACIEPPGHRPCLVISAYLQDGKGLAAVNLGHLAAIGTRVRMHGDDHPFIIGGFSNGT